MGSFFVTSFLAASGKMSPVTMYFKDRLDFVDDGAQACPCSLTLTGGISQSYCSPGLSNQAACSDWTPGGALTQQTRGVIHLLLETSLSQITEALKRKVFVSKKWSPECRGHAGEKLSTVVCFKDRKPSWE